METKNDNIIKLHSHFSKKVKRVNNSSVKTIVIATIIKVLIQQANNIVFVVCTGIVKLVNNVIHNSDVNTVNKLQSIL